MAENPCSFCIGESLPGLDLRLSAAIFDLKMAANRNRFSTLFRVLENVGIDTEIMLVSQ